MSLRQIGKKGRQNIVANKRLDAFFIASGINYCELGLNGCNGTFGLTRAHLRKRKHLTAEQLGDPQYAVLACLHCHQVVEALHPAKMEAIIQAAIDRRS